MPKQSTARLIKIVDNTDNQDQKTVCLCGRSSSYAQRTDCIIGAPGTPWWKALQDAEVGDTVTIHLPSKTLHVTVAEEELLPASAAA